jgi:cytochrome c biogenesis protein CcmG/thiol:disulfide interchange protein DsbE
VKSSFLSILFSAILLAGCNRPPGLINATAPDFTVRDSDRTVSLHDLKGKPVVLNFWTTWCGPCVQEMPSLVQLQKRLGDHVTILAVSLDEDENAYHRFLRDYHIDLLTVRDPAKNSTRLYGTTGQPETFLIDASGKVRRKFVGPADWTNPEIIDYLNRL